MDQVLAGASLWERLRQRAAEVTPAPAALIVFGSTVRGEEQADSDVDVLAVRPDGIDFDDDAWAEAVAEWCWDATEIAGRQVEMIEAGEDEVPGLLRRSGPCVWQDIAQEGVVVSGRPLSAFG